MGGRGGEGKGKGKTNEKMRKGYKSKQGPVWCFCSVLYVCVCGGGGRTKGRLLFRRELSTDWALFPFPFSSLF